MDVLKSKISFRSFPRKKCPFRITKLNSVLLMLMTIACTIFDGYCGLVYLRSMCSSIFPSRPFRSAGIDSE